MAFCHFPASAQALAALFSTEIRLPISTAGRFTGLNITIAQALILFQENAGTVNMAY